jgi:hypothetical protein
MRNFILSLLAVLVIASPAFAGVDAADIPSIDGKGIVAETGIAGDTLFTGAGIPGIFIPVFFEADDTAAYTGPTAATIDTGTEACAVFALTCAAVFSFDDDGASGDEFVAVAACSTDNNDGVVALALCY